MIGLIGLFRSEKMYYLFNLKRGLWKYPFLWVYLYFPTNIDCQRIGEVNGQRQTVKYGISIWICKVIHTGKNVIHTTAVMNIILDVTKHVTKSMHI